MLIDVYNLKLGIGALAVLGTVSLTLGKGQIYIRSADAGMSL